MTIALGGYLEDLICAWLRGTNMPAVPTLELGLSTADPTDAGSGITEPGGGYARQAIAFGALSVTESPGVQMSNNALIQFTGLGVSVITHVFITDASDNLLWYGPVTSTRAVQAGSDFDFQSGDITLTIGGIFSSYLASEVMNWCKGVAMDAAPTATFMALSKANPLRDHSGFNEVGTSIGYDRQEITFGAPSSSVGVGTTILNTSAVTFGPATTGTWGACTHGVIFDDAVTPNPLIYAPLSSPKSVVIGEGIGLATGTIGIVVR